MVTETYPHNEAFGLTAKSISSASIHMALSIS